MGGAVDETPSCQRPGLICQVRPQALRYLIFVHSANISWVLAVCLAPCRAPRNGTNGTDMACVLWRQTSISQIRI